MTNLEIENAYVGGSQVSKIYLGVEQIYPTIDYSQIPLTFEILSAGTITWERYGGASTNAKTIQYRNNGGEWVSITSNTGSSAPYVNVVPGDIVEFKGNNNSYYSGAAINKFSGSTTFKAYGNILSLIYGDNYQTETELPSGNTIGTQHNFDSLFKDNTGLTDASNIIMPQNTKDSCYRSMFYGCTNLEKIPILPASVLSTEAYMQMFDGCHKVSYIKCLATDISATRSVEYWVNGVAATGTFVKHPNTTWSTGRDGIPSGWNVIDADL